MANRWTAKTGGEGIGTDEIADGLDYEFGLFWDDLRAPATAINPTGPVSAATPDATTPGLLFAAGQDNLVHVIMQMPHSWLMGSAVYPHLHWEPATNNVGTVKWQLSYRWRNVGDVSAAMTNLTLLTVETSGTANKIRYSAFDSIDGTTKGLSSILEFSLQRVGTADTFTGNARLIEFDIHYQLDSRGSRQETAKY